MRLLIVILVSGFMGALVPLVHPMAPLAALVVVAVLAIAFSSPFALLSAFMGVLFTRPAEFFPVLAQLQMAKVFALAAIAMFLAVKLLRSDISWATSRHNRWMALLVVAILASSMRGTNPAESFATFSDVFLKILILYVLILNLVDSRRRSVAFQLVIAGLCSLLGLFALQAKITGTATIEGSRAALVGYLGDSNDLALTILMAVPFLIETTWSSSGRRRLLFGLLTFVALGGLLSTQSRGGLLGLAVGGYLILRIHITSRMVTAFILGLGLIVAFGLSGIEDRSSGGGESDGIDESAQGRLDAWGAGFGMVRSNPLLGIGFNRFMDNYERYVSNPVEWGPKAAHNSYVKCVAEVGLLGVIPFLVLVGRSLLVSFGLRQRIPPDITIIERSLLRSQSASLAGVLVAAFFLSATWNWFLYIMISQAAASERVWSAT